MRYWSSCLWKGQASNAILFLRDVFGGWDSELRSRLVEVRVMTQLTYRWCNQGASALLFLDMSLTSRSSARR